MDYHDSRMSEGTGKHLHKTQLRKHLHSVGVVSGQPKDGKVRLADGRKPRLTSAEHTSECISHMPDGHSYLFTRTSKRTRTNKGTKTTTTVQRTRAAFTQADRTALLASVGNNSDAD